MLDLFKICFKAQKSYIINRIQYISNRNHYYNACASVYKIFTESTDLDSLEMQLLEKRTYFKYKHKFGFHLFSDPKKYYVFAFNQALDICRCLKRRFITGYENV